MYKIPGTFILTGLAILLSACSFSMAADITPPPGSEQEPALQATESNLPISVYPIVPPNLENGAKLYKQECTYCHGINGLGDGPQASQLSVAVATLGLSDFSRLYSPAEWYLVVTQGKMHRFMPAFPNLTDRQRWDVVAYAMSLGTSQELINQGKDIYQDNCTTCHGLKGKGDGPNSSKLSTRPEDLTDQSVMAGSSAASLYQAITSGVAPDMPAYASLLDEDERWALVGYLRSLTFAFPSGSGDAYPAPAENVEFTPSLNPYPVPGAYPSPIETQNTELLSTSEVTPTTNFIGSVTVELINGSGGDAPSDVPVTLYGFDDMQNTYSETLTTGEDGVFAFTNIHMPEGRVFLAGTNYASATYGSDIVSVDPTNPNLMLQIPVYDSTMDVSVLTTDRVHIFFDFTDPHITQVIEVFIISNPTNQAVVSPSEDGRVVTFPLPEGYSNLQFQDGELGNRYIEVDGGFADTMSVKPGVGEYQVIFAYQMPYNRKLNITQTMFLPTSAVVVMVPDNGVKVDSNQLQEGGTRDFQGSTYQMYNGSSLLAGSALEFTLTGRPAQTSNTVISSVSMQNLVIGLGVFGVVLLAVGLWLFRWNQIKSTAQLSSDGTDLGRTDSGLGALLEDEDTLIDTIIALDDQYRAGNLPEEAYLERRAILKEKLRKIDQG